MLTVSILLAVSYGFLAAADTFVPSGVLLTYNASCTNPNRLEGRCVLVKECSTVVATLRKEVLNRNDILFLYESKCGTLEQKSLVCCSLESLGPAVTPAVADQFNTANRVDRPQQGELDLANWELLPKVGECGVQPSYQQFGENVTKLDEQPWTALIHFGNKPYETTFDCGGALISSRYVLTAAHCVNDSTKWERLTVRLGEWDTEATVDCITIGDYSEFYCADPATDVPVEKVIVHEQYYRMRDLQLNDIALLRLAEAVASTAWIRPVCLPQQQLTVAEGTDEPFILAGWGNNGCGYNSRYKIRSKLSVLSQEQCQRNFPTGFRLTRNYLCTTPLNAGEKCHADSGGAVTGVRQVAEVGTIHEVVGLLNNMRQCKSSAPLGIFTNVGQYVSWIISKLEE